ncbi:hypothetical protein SprV_0702260000 [Sparganum proliferum]
MHAVNRSVDTVDSERSGLHILMAVASALANRRWPSHLVCWKDRSGEFDDDGYGDIGGVGGRCGGDDDDNDNDDDVGCGGVGGDDDDDNDDNDDDDGDGGGSANELRGDINTNMTAPSLSPVHVDEAKGPVKDVQTAEDRRMLNKDSCIIIQGLPESSASTPRERVAADLEQFQKLLNEMLQPTEDVTVLKAFRLGSRTNALHRRYHDP